MWKKKLKTMKVVKPKEVEEIEEVPEEEIEEEVETEEVEELRHPARPLPKQERSIKQAIQEEAEEVPKDFGTIVSIELVEGMRYRNIVFSTKPIGQVGERFELD